LTIAEIATAAGVAKMTVTNYFPRKEDLVFDRADAIIGQLAEEPSLAGLPREQICGLLGAAADRAFDLLEPAIGDYGRRPESAACS
jgi:AcrR family transcriptional regulator